MNEDEKAEIRGLANRLFGLTDFSCQKSGLQEASETRVEATDSLTRAAARELRRRAVRKDILPPDLFGEGAWNMLLDLFLQERNGSLVAVMSICTAADVPPTTALRQLGQLIEMGLVHRIDDREDRRRHLIRLTRMGQDAMERVLAKFEEEEQKADKILQARRGPTQ